MDIGAGAALVEARGGGGEEGMQPRLTRDADFFLTNRADGSSLHVMVKQGHTRMRSVRKGVSR